MGKACPHRSVTTAAAAVAEARGVPMETLISNVGREAAPDQQAEAVVTAIEQAEAVCREWGEAA